jgi:hypothetical protein
VIPGLTTVLLFGLLLYCVLDIVLSDAAAIRNLPKLVWLVLVLLVPLIGALVWFIAGRPLSAGLAPGSTAPSAAQAMHRHPARGRPRPRPPQRPVARGPDDDPEFLRRLDERLKKREEDDGDA